MKAVPIVVAFVGGAALAATSFWIGREAADPTASARLDAAPAARDVGALVARIEDLELRLDSYSRMASPAAVRRDEERAPGPIESRGAAAPAAAPAASSAEGPRDERFAGFEDLRRLREAPDDDTKLEIARTILAGDNPMAAMQALRVLADPSPKEALGKVDQWVGATARGEMNAWQVDRAIATLLDSDKVDALGTEVDSKLREWYARGDDELKRTTARTLEGRGEPGPMQQLVASYRADLGTSDIGRRTRAVESLGRTRSKEAVPALLPMLADPSDEVRLGALDALRRTGNESAIEQVRPLLDDPVAAVRDRATRTIESLRRGEREGDWRGGDWRGGDFRGGFDGGRRGGG